MMKVLKVILWGIIVLQASWATGQEQIVEFLKASEQDANKFANSYMNPALVSFGQGLNGGWFNTARTHKSGGVELLISVNAVFVPETGRSFTFDNNDYESAELADGSISSSLTPTILGTANDGPDIVFTSSGFRSDPIPAPPGIGLEDAIGFNAVPVPTLQLGIGIVKNTDLKIRYASSFNNEDIGKWRYYGVGIMHDIKQWIPGLKKAPFHLAILGTYSKMSADADASGIIDGSNQTVKYNVESITAQVIISKKLSVFDFYGSLGYNTVMSNLDLLGTYEVETTVTYTDPVHLNVNESGLRGTIGMRLKLGFFQIYGDYTLSDYNVVNAGIGFTFAEKKVSKKR